MDINEFYSLLSEYTLNNENYRQWRKIHGEAFGDIFLSAFRENEEAQIHLTAALISISQRNFAKGMPVLKHLECLCDNEYDSTAINYFIGLNHEFLGNEPEMTEYYEKVLSSDINFLFNFAFHPYYRTAKFAQRDSECSKALYYYFKALDFHKKAELNEQAAKIVCHIVYDIATVYGYMHDYDKAEHFLSVSYKYDKSENQHRDYVNAIVHAVRGEEEETGKLVRKMSPFLKSNCRAMCDAILSGKDVHYCVTHQDRTGHKEFIESFLSDENELTELVRQGEMKKAEDIISEKLTDTFSFMNKKLDCRVEEKERKIVVRCKNYCVKTLQAEYEALFDKINERASDWCFLSVDEFEHYDIS